MEKFFADRGTHLAAMIAYFALLAFVPLLFLAIALFALAGQQDESSALVTELKRIFPGSSVTDIVRVVNAIERNAAALGIIGAVTVLWTSLSLFNALESAFNIVYGRPNRSFLHGKALAVLIMFGSLLALFAGLLVGSLGAEVLNRVAPGVIGNFYVAYALSMVVSTGATFAFLVSMYYLLTNERLELRDVLPGAVTASLLLQVTFQILPLYLRASKEFIALQALGAPVILLVWLYVMANVIVFGAEVNWWRSHGRRDEVAEQRPGLA